MESRASEPDDDGITHCNRASDSGCRTSAPSLVVHTILAFAPATLKGMGAQCSICQLRALGSEALEALQKFNELQLMRLEW